jgi:hypothetical protein
VAATTDAARAGPEGPGARRGWRTAALAFGLYAFVLLLLFATFPVLDRMLRDAGRPDLALLAPFVVAPTLAALTPATVGVVLARRRPRHPVGWLLLGVGLFMAMGG